MNFNPLSFLGDIFGKVADKVSIDKNKIAEGQTQLNLAEIEKAPASRLFTWRAFVGCVCGVVFAFEIIARPILATYWPHVPLPPSALGEVMRLLLVMLGAGW